MNINIKRIIAFLIDLFVYAFVWAILLTIIASIFYRSIPSEGERKLVVIVLALFALVPMILRDLTVSVGKYIMGLRVVSINDKKLSRIGLILRNITIWEIPHVELIVMIVCGRRLGDMMSKSTVIDIRKKELDHVEET